MRLHSESDPELCHWPKHTMKGTAGAEIIDILAPAAEDKVFYKNSFNAFSSGELNPYLHENRVSRLIVTGVHTTICITETVMRAYYLGYDTVVPQECVEAYSDEEQLFGSSTSCGAITRRGSFPRKSCCASFRTRGSRSPRGKNKKSPGFCQAKTGLEIYSVLFGDGKRPERDHFIMSARSQIVAP